MQLSADDDAFLNVNKQIHTNKRFGNPAASLKMKASGSSKTPVNLYHTAKRRFPDNSNHHSDARQYNRSHKLSNVVNSKGKPYEYVGVTDHMTTCVTTILTTSVNTLFRLPCTVPYY